MSVTFGTIERKGIGELDEYQLLASQTAIYPHELPENFEYTGLIYAAMGAAGEAGEMLNKLKKWLLRDSHELTEEQTKMLEAEVGDLFWYVAALATELGVDLSSIAEKNIEKLFSRKERNVLGGSGDKR